MKDLDALYRLHVDTVLEGAQRALERSATVGEAYDGLILHAGSELLVHRDDQPHLFRPHFHFARFAPLDGPDHLLQLRPGVRPRLLRIAPRDYWYEAPQPPSVDLAASMDVEEFESIDDAVEALGEQKGHAFVGDDFEVAEALGLSEEAMEPDALMAALDWERGAKSEFEAECIRQAARRAAPAHRAVREGVAEGLCERALHHAYIAAAGLVEDEMPYPTIIGWDDHAAVLHYQRKEAVAPNPGGLLLIDAGASFLGYACDITRTYLRPERVPALLGDLLDGMEALQRRLVEGVRPGREYIDLHAEAHREIAELLCGVGVLRGNAATAIEKGLTLPFFPHGLGHHMGLQVHDVGGRQIDPDGTERDTPAEHPYLRTTRRLEVGHVVTIEPGLYFIPMLLAPLREGAHSALVDWDAIDTLTPFGGIRIEDDVLVTAEGREDLTRPQVPGHLTD